MTRKVLFFAAIAIATMQRDARACSCSMLQLAYLTPRGNAAATTAHVRMIAPSYNLQPSRFVLRVHNGAVIPTTTKTYPEQRITIVELVPSAPLPASTRFEVATIDPSQHPPTTVIGTFMTGTTADTTAPRLASLGTQRTRLNTSGVVQMCGSAGPWIEFDGVAARDDHTPAEYLAFGVWAPNATGVIDTRRQPDVLLFSYDRQITIGTSSACDPRRFDFAAPVVTLAIAAFDDSGNMSRAVRFRADLTKNTP